MLLERVRTQHHKPLPNRPYRIQRRRKQWIHNNQVRMNPPNHIQTLPVYRNILLPAPRRHNLRQHILVRLAGSLEAQTVETEGLAGVEMVALLQGLFHGRAGEDVEGCWADSGGARGDGEEGDGAEVKLGDGAAEGREGGDVDGVGWAEEEFVGNSQADRGLA